MKKQRQTEVKVESRKQHLGKETNLPSVNGTNDASKDNAGSGNAGNIKGNVNLGGENAAQVLDKATDLTQQGSPNLSFYLLKWKKQMQRHKQNKIRLPN